MSLEERLTQLEDENFHLQQELERVRRSNSCTDPNGIQVHDGQMYGIDESGNLYDLEPLVPFKPSEY